MLVALSFIDLLVVSRSLISRLFEKVLLKKKKRKKEEQKRRGRNGLNEEGAAAGLDARASI